MSIFRHPKTQNERKADQAVLHEDSLENAKIHARVRTGAKGKGLRKTQIACRLTDYA